MFALLLSTMLGHSDTDAKPEPSPTLEKRVIGCKRIVWAEREYPIVFCPTGIVWAPWSSRYGYVGTWSLSGNVIVIQWQAYDRPPDGGPASIWDVQPICAPLVPKGRQLELRDVSGPIALVESIPSTSR